MNTHDHPNDDSLPGEEELQALYRSLPRKEPTPALDQAVHAAAAAAVRAQTRKRIARWPIAAASAAVVLLAVGLGLRMREQPTRMQAPALVTQNAATVTEPQPSASAPGGVIAQANLPEAPVATIAAPRPRIAKTTRHMHESAKPITTSPAADALAEQTYAPSAQPTPTPLPAPAPAMATAQPPATAMAMAAPTAPAPPSASADARAAPEARSMAMKTMAMPAAAAPMAAPMMVRAAPVDLTAPHPNDTPAQELDKIRALFAQHRRDEALQRIATFRQAHPDIPLPDDLRAQLPDHE
jgi:Meckel syndrome type 1 protein